MFLKNSLGVDKTLIMTKLITERKLEKRVLDKKERTRPVKRKKRESELSIRNRFLEPELN